MKAIKYKLKHVYQPTNNTCGYASLSMLLSHYGMDVSVDDLVSQVPQPKNESGEKTGSVTAQLVTWCADMGLKTHMYASDAEILDLTWQNKTEDQIVKRLKLASGKKLAAVMGPHWTKVYVEAYLEMLNAGSKLSVVQFIRADLIYKLLDDGPVFANICSTVERGNGRTIEYALRKSKPDDIYGKVTNHSIVIYGHKSNGDFLVADPWEGLTVVDPEAMVISIAAAQIECDNQVFVIESR